MMNFNRPLTRRESLRTLFNLSGALTLTGAAVGALKSPLSAWSAPGKKFLVEAVGQVPGYNIKSLTRKAFDAAGGISRFIARGDVVVIKPNLSWARAPQFGATTHPEVLQAVIELCQEAGARRVRIADNTIHDARRCFAVTGAGLVAKNTGAELIHPRSSMMREMDLKGNLLGSWPVFVPLVEADKLINLPVAKHHSLSSLTLGMKNWIGAVDGSRWSLHQDIDESIVDLSRFFKPTVTLIDAIRIMTRNGPSGGSTADVAPKHTLILSDDPVAADAGAAQLFGRRPDQLGFVRLAQKSGLGTYDFSTLDRRRVLL